MSAKNVTEILKAVEAEEFLLPDFQRGYVWKVSQAEKYFKSLYRKYPTGSLIMWSAPKKYLETEFNRNKEARLILDGQQRVTTLYISLTGRRPRWMQANGEVPRIYFDVENEEFKAIKKFDNTKHRSSLCIRDIYNSDIKSLIESSHDPDFFQQYHDRICNLFEILNYPYHISVVDEPDVREVVEMFNALNSEGTRLSETDLALAIMVITWPSAKAEIERLVSKYKLMHFTFDKEFLVRCLNIVSCDRAKYTDLKFMSTSKLESSLKNIEKALDYIISIWREKAFVSNSNLFSSLHPFMIVVYFVCKNSNKFINEQERDKSIFFTLVAMLWGRYSGATEATLEKDVRFIRERNSFDLIIKEIAQQRGNRIFPTIDDIRDKGTNTTILKIIQISILSKKPHDWFDPSLPLVPSNGTAAYSIENHHIFSKKLLKQLIPTTLGKTENIVTNQVANIAFITSLTNKNIADAGPSLYLKNVNKSELVKQYIPTDEDLWAPDFETYCKFINERSRLIKEGIAAFLKSFYPDFKIESEIDTNLLSLRIKDFEHKIRSIISNRFADSELSIREYVGDTTYEKVKLRRINYQKVNPQADANIENINDVINNLEMMDYLRIIASDKNWKLFTSIFIDPKIFRDRFHKVTQIRNIIAHNNDVDQISIKDSEASFLWFDAIFKKFNSESNATTNTVASTSKDNFDPDFIKTLLENKYSELKNDLLSLDNKINFPFSINNSSLTFSPSQWGMSNKDIAPIVFSVKINTGESKQNNNVIMSIEFTDVFKRQYRELFLKEFIIATTDSDLSFYEFETSENIKNLWIIRKSYTFEKFMEKILQDYIELTDSIYNVGKVIKKFASLKYFTCEINFY